MPSFTVAPTLSDAGATFLFRNSIADQTFAVLVLARIIPNFSFATMSLTSASSSVSTDETKNPTLEELRTWACCIRDVLLPRTRAAEGMSLSVGILNEVQEFLSLLKQVHIDTETLRYIRVHNALEEIGAIGSKLPRILTGRAGELLSLWEADLGPLTDIQADLFGPEGRLAGVAKLKEWGKASKSKVTSGESPGGSTAHESRNSGTGWNVEGGNGPFHSFREGHNGFKVGDWWIKRAAAYRDGIIHGLADGVTADEEGAYAILMTEHDELETSTGDTVRYRSSQLDPGCCKLMKNLETRRLVRVLRSWRLSSKWGPRAGLRYDGLYRVCGYGVKLITTASGEDVWQYTFTLERHNAQPCFDEALCRPSAEQMDDWNNYKKMTADLLKVEVNQLYHIVGKAKVIKSSADQPSDRRESGYFTGGSSEEEKTS